MDQYFLSIRSMLCLSCIYLELLSAVYNMPTIGQVNMHTRYTLSSNLFQVSGREDLGT